MAILLFSVPLTCLDIMWCSMLHLFPFFFLYQKKEQSKKDEKQNSFLGNKAVTIAKIAV